MPSRLDFDDADIDADRIDFFAILFCFAVVVTLLLVFGWLAQPAERRAQANSTAFNAEAFLAELNAYRSRSGTSSLVLNKQLTSAARKHAEWCLKTGTLGHEGPNGETFVDRVRDARYPGGAVTENFAFLASEPSANGLLAAWQASPGHDMGLKMPATDCGVWVTPTSPSYCVWVSGRKGKR